MVAHDLRSPLAAIVNRTELIGALLDKNIVGSGGRIDDDPEGKTQDVVRGHRPVRASHGAHDCQAAGRCQEPGEDDPAACTEVDLVDPVRAAIGLNQRPQKPSSFASSRSSARQRIVADEDRLIEAIDNLVSNAVKYSERAARSWWRRASTRTGLADVRVPIEARA